MMNNLFSTFDPSSSLYFTSSNWVILSMIVLILPSKFWAIPSKSMCAISLTTEILSEEFMALFKKKEMSGSLMYIAIFHLILLSNFMGLFPYIFTSTTHLSINLPIALIMWVSIMLYNTIKNTMNMMAHMVPQGTPPLLTSFMVLIETTSNIIRPLALAVRLTANMIAGHLLLTLIGSSNPSMLLMSFVLVGQIMLMLLEMSVSIIQAYVFTILVVLYSNENT